MMGSRLDVGGGAWRYRLLAAAVLFAVIAPRIAQRGMFLDGMTYAVVARNMAIGVGTAWSPTFSATAYSTFHEQPPVGLWLESLAFRAFGDHMWVERAFSLLILVVHGILITRIWRRLLPARYDALPLFFWVLPSTVTWGAINNMLENVQALFTTLSVACLIVGVQGTKSSAIGWGALAGTASVIAVLVKGPVGLFPLAVPPLLLLVDRHTGALKRVASLSAAMWTSTAVSLVSLVVAEAARHAILEFARTHLVPTLQGRHDVSRRSADIARHLTLGIGARMVGLAALIWIATRRYLHIEGVGATAALFLTIGLLASLPILVSPVLAGHYFLPAVPFFALSMAALTMPVVAAIPRPGSQFKYLAPVALAVLLVVMPIVVVTARGPLEPRDVRLIQSLDAVSSSMPIGETVGTCKESAEDWGLKGYLQRFFRVSVDARGLPVNGWFLIASGDCAPAPICRLVATSAELTLYNCRIL